MAVAIDKGKTALLIMDVQNDITHPDAPMANAMGFAQEIQRTGLFDRLGRLLGAARESGLFVVHVLIDLKAGTQPRWPQRGPFFAMVQGGPVCARGTWGGAPADAVAPRDGEAVVYKCIFSAFASSGLHELLQQRGITDLILTGVSTDAVVTSTAWDANDRGYSNILVADGCVCATQEKHDQTVRDMAGRCDVATTDEIITALRAA